MSFADLCHMMTAAGFTPSLNRSFESDERITVFSVESHMCDWGGSTPKKSFDWLKADRILSSMGG